MPVRLLRGFFVKVDGQVGDDFEALATGTVTVIPKVTGNAGCVLLEGFFAPRIG